VTPTVDKNPRPSIARVRKPATGVDVRSSLDEGCLPQIRRRPRHSADDRVTLFLATMPRTATGARNRRDFEELGLADDITRRIRDPFSILTRVSTVMWMRNLDKPQNNCGRGGVASSPGWHARCNAPMFGGGNAKMTLPRPSTLSAPMTKPSCVSRGSVVLRQGLTSASIGICQTTGSDPLQKTDP